jgi:hypothetical protein
LRSFKAVSFNLAVDDRQLNELPNHLLKLIQAQSTTVGSGVHRPVNQPDLTRQSKPKTDREMGGFAFDSFLKSFEVGFDSLVQQVDQIITNAPKINLPETILNPIKETSSQQRNDTVSLGTSISQNEKKRFRHFFGSSMKDLLLDEYRCQNAFIDPTLGIPTQSMKMIQFIYQHANTSQLFRQSPSVQEVEELKRSIENERGITVTANTTTTNQQYTFDISAVAYLFVQWLLQLPEPLFGYDHYEAIIACQEIEDKQERIRNLSIILYETPWYNKPLLLKVCGLFQHLLKPEIASVNQLNIIAMALLFTPCLLRPTQDQKLLAHSNIDPDSLHMSATAAGSTIIEFFILHSQEILKPIVDEISLKQQKLSEKCTRIRKLQEESQIQVDIQKLVDHYKLIAIEAEEKEADIDHKKQLEFHDSSNIHFMLQSLQTLFTLLAPVEQRLLSSDSISIPIESKSMIETEKSWNLLEIVKSERWKICAFVFRNQVLQDLNCFMGFITLRSIVNFMTK